MRVLKEGEYNISIVIKTFINEVKKGKCPELLDVISLRNIENDLNEKLKAIYVKPLDYVSANYDELTKSISINSKSNQYLLLNIIHEVIHALSHRIYGNNNRFRF